MFQRATYPAPPASSASIVGWLVLPPALGLALFQPVTYFLLWLLGMVSEGRSSSPLAAMLVTSIIIGCIGTACVGIATVAKRRLVESHRSAGRPTRWITALWLIANIPCAAVLGFLSLFLLLAFILSPLAALAPPL